MELQANKKIETRLFQLLKISSAVPTNAPNGTSAPIHANCCALGANVKGVSVSRVSLSLGETGDVQPIAVPTAMLDRLAKMWLLLSAA